MDVLGDWGTYAGVIVVVVFWTVGLYKKRQRYLQERIRDLRREVEARDDRRTEMEKKLAGDWDELGRLRTFPRSIEYGTRRTPPVFVRPEPLRQASTAPHAFIPTIGMSCRHKNVEPVLSLGTEVARLCMGCGKQIATAYTAPLVDETDKGLDVHAPIKMEPAPDYYKTNSRIEMVVGVLVVAAVVGMLSMFAWTIWDSGSDQREQQKIEQEYREKQRELIDEYLDSDKGQPGPPGQDGTQ